MTVSRRRRRRRGRGALAAFVSVIVITVSVACPGAYRSGGKAHVDLRGGVVDREAAAGEAAARGAAALLVEAGDGKRAV